MDFFNPLLSFYIVILSQAPRPLSESDLQGVLGTSTKTTVAANEYSRSSSHSPGWPGSQMTIRFKPQLMSSLNS